MYPVTHIVGELIDGKKNIAFNIFYDSIDIITSNLVTIKAQMIGTFYRSSAPEKPPFVEVGSVIKPGDTLCIIEAMKLFNEIESEVSGRIVKVLVDDVSPVEFDQPLFLIDPNI